MQTTLTGKVVVHTDRRCRRELADPLDESAFVEPAPSERIPCRFNCGKHFSWPSGEARHARACCIIGFERKNASPYHKQKLRMLELEAELALHGRRKKMSD